MKELMCFKLNSFLYYLAGMKR